MDKDYLKEIEEKNYLEKIDYTSYKSEVESVLIYGEHYDQDPRVTVVCPTYKRIDLLEIAIYSVLNQVDYYDYQMLIIDNEDVFDVETDTEKLIKRINSDKIVYYRNRSNLGIYANWNRGMKLARSKYICIMNDDDVLMANHLSTMMGIIESSDKIDILGCIHQHMYFRDNPNINVYEVMKPADLSSMNVFPASYFDFNYMFLYPVLGSIMKKECFLDVGGICPGNSIANEDYLFTTKMAYYHNMYICNVKLYGYYWGNNQSLKTEIWADSLVHEYFIYRSISRKRPFFVRPIFIARSKYAAIDLIHHFNNGTAWTKMKCDIDVAQYLENCGIKSDKYCTVIKRANTLMVKMLDKGCRKIR